MACRQGPAVNIVHTYISWADMPRDVCTFPVIILAVNMHNHDTSRSRAPQQVTGNILHHSTACKIIHVYVIRIMIIFYFVQEYVIHITGCLQERYSTHRVIFIRYYTYHLICNRVTVHSRLQYYRSAQSTGKFNLQFCVFTITLTYRIIIGKIRCYTEASQGACITFARRG